MPDIEPRYPCPVCLGVRMEKTRVGARGELVLDSCGRCGGIWFELGEVQRLTRHQPQALWNRVARRDELFRMQCHSCHAPMDRNASSCPTCDWRNTINCPVCDRPMHAEVHDGLRLDVCRTCKGVWFDHVELAAIWNLALERARHRAPGTGLASRPGGAIDVAEDSTIALTYALAYSPEIFVYGARAAGYAVSASAEVLASAPEAAAGLAAGVGEAAASVFESVLDIISGLFS
jgi:Zn-finger nucleic acid-binding protein